ncbi:hypothetical protein [Actinobaculum massiliense]|uniref:hypothetical protein n=1 Tax=Actinobaculum massiliense TaxID=202789 RepID=UPI00071AF62B|nr:hypothetical protein [Actinobaculum massiliense]
MSEKLDNLACADDAVSDAIDALCEARDWIRRERVTQEAWGISQDSDNKTLQDELDAALGDYRCAKIVYDANPAHPDRVKHLNDTARRVAHIVSRTHPAGGYL